MSLTVGNHPGALTGVQAPTGPVVPQGGGGTIGGHVAVAVAPPAVAVAVAAAPAPAPPAVQSYAAYKAATKLDGFLSKIFDKRSSELKDVDTHVQALLPGLSQAAGQSNADFLTAFASLKQAKNGLDQSVQAWDPSQHTRGAKVNAQLAQIQTAFASLQARYDQLIDQNPVANALPFAQAHGIRTQCVDAIVRDAPDAQSALESLSTVMNAARVTLDGTGLSPSERTDVLTMLAGADAAADTLVKTYSTGSIGNTPAHDLARQPTQLAALQTHLAAHGGDLDAENEIGHTPLTVAIVAHGTASVVRDLIGRHADVSPNGLFGVFKPIDLARATNRSAIIPDLVNAGAASGVDAQQLLPSRTQGMTTDAILMRGTLSQDASSRAFVQQAFTDVLAEPRLQPLLALAAQKMVGDPANEMTALRINHLGVSDAKLLSGLPSAGAYNPDTHTLNLASKASQKDMQGTMVHELTHHAIDEIWHNDDMPFSASDLALAQGNQPITGTGLESYVNAVLADQAHVGNDPDAAKVRAVVLDRVPAGYAARGTILNLPQGTFSTAMLQEYAVGIPQAINDFGYAAVLATTPNLLAFYENSILPAANQLTQTLANRTTP